MPWDSALDLQCLPILHDARGASSFDAFLSGHHVCVVYYACIRLHIHIYIYIYTHTYILAYISLCLCIVGDSGLDLQCLVYFWMREAFVNLKHFSLGIFMHLCHVCEDTTVGVNKKE